MGKSDIVVRAVPGKSGRLERCLPIGEFRNRAYRVRRDLLDAWGGLSVNDGYIQRSARPPRFSNPERFYRWFRAQGIRLLAANNDAAPTPPVVVVLLRQPRRDNPGESRDDPFWEFGSFGCTGCHEKNLMNPRRAARLNGTRLAFVQGGPGELKLVLLTPPVSVIEHGRRCEARWTPTQMPFRYNTAPLIIANDGSTDFPMLKQLLQSVQRTTLVGKFSSKFRARGEPLREDVGNELVSDFDRRYGAASPFELAETYVDALPYEPPLTAHDRLRSYRHFLRQAGRSDDRRGKLGSASIGGRCGTQRQKRCGTGVHGRKKPTPS